MRRTPGGHERAEGRRRIWIAILAAILAVGLVVSVLGWLGLRRPTCGARHPECAGRSAATPGHQVGTADGAVPGDQPSAAADPSGSQSRRPSSRTSPPSPTNPKSAAGGGPVCNGVPCSFPNASSAGQHGGLLARHDGNLSIRDEGMIIDHWDLHGSLDIYANNVTISNCRVASSNWWAVNLRPGFTGLRVSHCTLTGVVGKGQDNGGEDYAVSNMGNGSVEVGWNDISQFGNALSMGHGNIHDNYVHDLSAFITQSGSYEHTDAVISGGSDGAGLVIRHNTLLNQTHIDQGASAAIGLYSDNGPVTNTTIDRNWLAGGAYALYGGGAGATGITVTDNVFSTQYWPNGGYYGMVTAWNAGGAGNVWSGNVTSSGAAVQP